MECSASKSSISSEVSGFFLTKTSIYKLLLFRVVFKSSACIKSHLPNVENRM